MFVEVTPIITDDTSWSEAEHEGHVFINLDHVESIVRRSGRMYTSIYMHGDTEPSPAYIVLETPEQILGGINNGY